MTDLLTTEAITALFQVVMIDLVLAGDNAIVIGLAAAGLPQEQRTKAILVGIVAATALRILFASVTTQLLKLVGLLFAGGLILLWVCWKMWRELRTSAEEGREATEALIGYDTNADGTALLGRLSSLTCRCPLTMSSLLRVLRGSTRSCSFSVLDCRLR
jgi:predicted tellurium resistance membrane protein TerC